MPSNPDPLFHLELQAPGDHLNTWGDVLNAIFAQLVEGVSSALTLTITGDRTLTADNYMSNEYRRLALLLAGTPASAFTITVPPISKGYWVANTTGRAATIKTASGSGAVVRVGMLSYVLCDGTNCLIADPTLDQIRAAVGSVDFGGNKGIHVATGTADTDAANTKQVNDVVAAVASNASAAATSASSASTSATQAAASATQLQGSSSTSNVIGTGFRSFTTQSGKFFDAGKWLLIYSASNPANYFHGQSTSYSGASLTVNVTNTGGSGTASDWVIAVSGTQGPIGLPGIVAAPVTPKSSAYTVIAADRGALIDCTNSFILSITSAATLGGGFLFYARNSGTGVVTIDPAGAETVDGLASIRIYPGESLTLACSGTAFATIGRQRGSIFISSTTISGAVATADFETGFDDPEFKAFRLVAERLSHDSGTSAPIGILFKKSGAYQASGYQASTAAITDASNSGTQISISSSITAATSINSDIQITAPFSAGANQQTAIIATSATAGVVSQFITGNQSTAATLQGVRFIPAAGSLDAGVIRLYGVR